MAHIPHIGATCLLVVDGHNLAHAGSHDKHRQDRPHAVVEAVLSYLRKTVSALLPVKIVVTWDNGLAAWRKELYPDYKANRKKKKRTPEEAQADTIRKRDMQVDVKLLQDFILPSLGIDQLKGNGPTEADDLIFTVIQDYKENQRFSSAVILSTDQDMVQLLTPQGLQENPFDDLNYNVFQLSLSKLYVSQDEWKAGERISHRVVDGSLVKNKKGWYPEDHLFLRSITGDASDGIEGIAGVGAGFCRKLMSVYGSVKEVMRLYMEGSNIAWARLAKGEKTKLLRCLSKTGLELIQRNMKLMTLQPPEKPAMLIPGRAFEGLIGASIIDNVVAKLKADRIEPWGNGSDPFKWLSPFRDYCSTRAQRYRLARERLTNGKPSC